MVDCVGCQVLLKTLVFWFLAHVLVISKKNATRIFIFSTQQDFQFQLSFLQIMHICCFLFRFSIHDSSQEKELLLGHVSMILDMVRTYFFLIIIILFKNYCKDMIMSIKFLWKHQDLRETKLLQYFWSGFQRKCFSLYNFKLTILSTVTAKQTKMALLQDNFSILNLLGSKMLVFLLFQTQNWKCSQVHFSHSCWCEHRLQITPPFSHAQITCYCRYPTWVTTAELYWG